MEDNVSLVRTKDLLSVANMLSAFFVSKSDLNKTVVYRALTHHYQAVFQNAKPSDDKILLPLVDWKLYKAVSRTKLRHRVLYFAMRISPRMFRTVIKYV